MFTTELEVNTFDQLQINDKLKQVLKDNSYESLTKIQRQAVPSILKNQNVVLKSETGSGKTLAYLVPLIEFLSKYSLTVKKIHREDSGTMAVIFSPTRELAIQIDLELRLLLKLFYYLVPTTLIGGESVSREKSRLRKGCVILICTPGRLLYHLQNTQCLKLDNLKYMIIDEADRMLDMGFEKEMTSCLDLIKKKSAANFLETEEDQKYWSDTIKINLVSATIEDRVEQLGSRLMKSYEKVGF